MKYKSISYNNSHIPGLKKHIVWLALFGIGVMLVSIFQAVVIVRTTTKEIELTTWETVASYACIALSVIFLGMIVAEMIKYIALIKKVNASGSINSKIFTFDYSSKLSLGNMIRLFEYITLLITSIFVVGFTTYCVLHHLYYTTSNYFLPICFLLLLTTSYGTKMIELQYEIQK